MLDHASVRALVRCPLCTSAKRCGRLICSACYGRHDCQIGAHLEAMLDGLEALLSLGLEATL
jgi:hypothetical protein